MGLEACDPSVRTALGETALHLSAVRGDERVCQTLLDGGCPPEAVTREGKTALHLAAGMGETWKEIVVREQGGCLSLLPLHPPLSLGVAERK